MAFKLSNPDAPATYNQRRALFFATKKDYRDVEITMQEASDLIAQHKNGKGKTAKKGSSPKSTKNDKFQELWNRAQQAGVDAATVCKTSTMVVTEHTSPLDDNSPAKRRYIVPGGPCGFAWVKITPATSSFVRWLKSKNIGHKSYYGGWEVSIFEYNQSMELKMSHAAAMARVLSESGLDAYADSRMD